VNEPLILGLAAIAGAAFGVLADRLATRWPEHEPGVVARRLDWRTLVVALTGAVVAAGLLWRWGEPRDLAILAIYCAALVVLLATDLDQKLLPDLLTLPLIPFCAAVLLLGWSPLLATDPNALITGLAAGIGAPVLLAVTDFVLKGALGFGDLKLAVSIGLMSGVSLFFTGFLLASIAVSVLLLVLVAARQLGMRTAIPFGPILIGAAFIAALWV
jgi:leader peptidase (prepilin peptidase) / N-methyltransferase